MALTAVSPGTLGRAPVRVGDGAAVMRSQHTVLHLCIQEAGEDGVSLLALCEQKAKCLWYGVVGYAHECVCVYV